MITNLPPPPRSLRKLSDSELWVLFSELGTFTRQARQRFLAMLPEISRRRLHRRRSFPSLLACAQQVGGVSQRTVESILALHRRLRTTPRIWRLVETAEVGWSVIDRVPQALLEADPIAWERNLRELSKREIEALVRAARPPRPGPEPGPGKPAHPRGASRHRRKPPPAPPTPPNPSGPTPR